MVVKVDTNLIMFLLKVAQQCKENIFAIQTLKDFQYFEESKDQGLNVREKAKQLVLLLKDDERLRNERARALKAKERFAQAASGFGSDGMLQGSWSSCEMEPTSRELETARPQTVGEEELQLQLALAMSREEAEQEEQRRRSDDVRLQLALSQSEEEFNRHQQVPQPKSNADKQSHMLDLLDVNLGNSASQPASAVALDPWGFPQPVPQSPPTRPRNDPWSSPASSMPSASTVASPTPVVDPWTPVPSATEPIHKPAAPVDPWRAVSPQPPSRPTVPANDPWSPSTNTDHSSPGTGSPRGGLSSPNGGDLDEFDIITNRERPAVNNSQVNNVNSINNNGGTMSPDPFDLSVLEDSLESKQQQKKTPHSFLGENSALVNLDNLVTVSKPPSVTPSPGLQTFGIFWNYTGIKMRPVSGNYFPENFSAFSEENGERFHQDIKDIEIRYQEKWSEVKETEISNGVRCTYGHDNKGNDKDHDKKINDLHKDHEKDKDMNDKDHNKDDDMDHNKDDDMDHGKENDKDHNMATRSTIRTMTYTTDLNMDHDKHHFKGQDKVHDKNDDKDHNMDHDKDHGVNRDKHYENDHDKDSDMGHDKDHRYGSLLTPRKRSR
ncbi:hypothetical protein ANN_04552 [Periplaneta americana]|uniref:ENTH domain-containing protein n=1 Tax=Periplaneta americana TaxID=6978 RepID=A0ABQ8TAG1_PERAM|nr:hypothetical protein ANN_04552 [Periplaneta americana]